MIVCYQGHPELKPYPPIVGSRGIDPEESLTMRNVIKICLCLALIAMSSCAPRGETKTLEEIFSAEEVRYNELKDVSTPAGVGAALTQLNTLLPELVNQSSSDSNVASASEVATLLTGLRDRAGYTSRPALGELVKQYRQLELSLKDEIVDSGKVKLLVARTYSALSSELSTTGFRVS